MLADLQRAETVFLRRSRMAGQTHTDQAGVTREQTRGLGGATAQISELLVLTAFSTVI